MMILASCPDLPLYVLACCPVLYCTVLVLRTVLCPRPAGQRVLLQPSGMTMESCPAEHSLLAAPAIAEFLLQVGGQRTLAADGRQPCTKRSWVPVLEIVMRINATLGTQHVQLCAYHSITSHGRKEENGFIKLEFPAPPHICVYRFLDSVTAPLSFNVGR